MRLLAILGLAACSSDVEQRHEARDLGVISTPPDVSRQREKARDRHAVELFVDGIVVATIGEHQFGDWPRIDLQLPPDATLDRWRSLRIETDGDPVTLDRRAYPTGAPVLFPGTGRAANFGLFDPRTLDKRGVPAVRVDGVREIHVELAPVTRHATRSPLERACTEIKRGEEKPPPGKGRWQGTAYQHNIDEHWIVDLTIDLSGSKPGDKVGTIVFHGHKCRGTLYRLPDVNGRPRVVERFWHNESDLCVEDCIIELACDGTALDYKGYYPDGTYVAHAKLLRK